MIGIKRKWLAIIIFLIIITSLGCTLYIYYQYHPKVIIETKILPVDDETYNSIGGLDYVKHPEKDHFKQLKSTIKVSYSNTIKEVEIELSKSFVELLGKDIYWSGKYWEQLDDNVFEQYNEMILYMGETNEQQLKEMLSKGTITVTWIENGKVKNEKHSLDESVEFVK